MVDVSKFIVIIRPEFMTFCQDACRAATLNHLLFRIAGKCKDQPKEKIQAGEILWYAKNEQITAEMSHAWGVCKTGKEVNELVKMNLLGRCSNPEWGVDRTKHFFFGTEQCATFLKFYEEQNLCFVHADLPDEVKHLIYSSNANDKSIKCKCVIHQMQVIDSSNAFDISIKAITKIDYKEDTKNNTKEESVSASAERTPFIHPEHSFLAFDNLEHPTLMTISWFIDHEHGGWIESENKRRGWIADEVEHQLEAKGIHVQVLKAEEHPSRTVDAERTFPPVVSEVTQPEPLPIATPTQEEPHDGKVTQAIEDAAYDAFFAPYEPSKPEPTVESKVAVQVIPPLEQAAMVELSPPIVDKSQANGDKPSKTKKPVEPPVMPSEDAPWCAETLVEILEARRGSRFPNGARNPKDRIRDKALRDGRTIVEMDDVDRVAFIFSVDRLETRKNGWWLDNVGHVFPYHLLKDDKIHTMMDELKRQYGPSWKEVLLKKTRTAATPSTPEVKRPQLGILRPMPTREELRKEAF